MRKPRTRPIIGARMMKISVFDQPLGSITLNDIERATAAPA